MKQQQITDEVKRLAKEIAKHWRMEIVMGVWFYDTFLKTSRCCQVDSLLPARERIPIPDIGDCLEKLSSIGRIRAQIPSFNSFAFGEITFIEFHESLLSALLAVLKES